MVVYRMHSGLAICSRLFEVKSLSEDIRVKGFRNHTLYVRYCNFVQMYAQTVCVGCHTYVTPTYMELNRTQEKKTSKITTMWHSYSFIYLFFHTFPPQYKWEKLIIIKSDLAKISDIFCILLLLSPVFFSK